MANSPLFSETARQVQEAARNVVHDSEFGRLLYEFTTITRAGRAHTHQLDRVLDQFSRLGGEGALRQIQNMTFGQFSQELVRYADRGHYGRLLNQWLSQLGPVGKLIRGLANAGSRANLKSVDSLAHLAHAMGLEVMLPPRLRGAFKQLDARGVEAAKQFLTDHGFTLIGPGETLAEENPVRTSRPQGPGRTPQRGFEVHPSGGEGLAVGGHGGGLPPDHPAVTGDMLPAPESSNVWSFGYDLAQHILYIRYRSGLRSQQGRRDSPGPLYAYYNVPLNVFEGMRRAQSKGHWVWEEIRVRGTLSQHHYPYALVGVVGDYVPRAARAWRDPASGRLEEGWIKRQITTTSGRTLVSSYANEVPDLSRLPPSFLGMDRPGSRPWSPDFSGADATENLRP